MRYATPVLAITGLTLWFASSTAQTPGPDAVQLRPLSGTAGNGVSNALLLDRDGIRVFRVDVDPGGRRNVHAHDDVARHLFLPVTGGVQLEIDSEQPRSLAAWRPYLLPGGVRHGFSNAGSSPSSVIEVFVGCR
jgi:quercetin dioxygenase-like cupin family protein